MEETLRRSTGATLDDIFKEVKKAISDQVHHRYVDIVSSGSCGLVCAIAATGGKVMVPDQGGWKGFLDYPSLVGLETCFLETDLGLIDLETLEESLVKESPKALIVTSFAGYICEQDIRGISRLCREHGVLLVEDVSGAIGDRNLADGRHSDIIVCSTGSPKILNVGTGGFVTCQDKGIRDSWRVAARVCKASPMVAAGIREELGLAKERVRRLLGFSELLKEQLPGVVHPGRKGICVGIKLDDINPKRFTKKAHASGLVTDQGRGFLTTCPRYERFYAGGVVVELKKLYVEKMGQEDISNIADILKSCM
jgi:hypothetical protein